MKRFVLLSVAATGVALVACGSLDANTGSAPALATLQGNLSNPQSLSVAGAVRVAVVWRSDAPGQFNVAEDLPVQPVFPSSFTIALDGPPPAAAMMTGVPNGSGSAPTQGTPSSGPPTVTGTGPNGSVPDAGVSTGLKLQGGTTTPTSLQLAYGTVVAYVDQNGNGKLDLVPAGASAYVDRIVASNDEMAIVYLQGTIPSQAVDAYGRMPTEGYNLVRIPRCDVALPSSRGPGSACTSPPPVQDAGTCVTMQWFGMDTPYPLTIASSPSVSNLMCLSDSGSSGGSSAGGTGGGPPSSVQPAQYPDPCDENLSCAPDGSSYFYTTCSTLQEGICEGTVTSCTSVGYSRPATAPAGWPCIH